MHSSLHARRLRYNTYITYKFISSAVSVKSRVFKHFSLFVHQTPVYCEYSRLNWCPDLLDHYNCVAGNVEPVGDFPN
jgi:hypothetical protein